MLRKKKGFTLAELLIVVAIIGVLVAISVPIFTAQLKKARLATNQANCRSAKSAVYDYWLTLSSEGKLGGGHKELVEYDVKTGKATKLNGWDQYTSGLDCLGNIGAKDITKWTIELNNGVLCKEVYDIWYVQIGEDDPWEEVWFKKSKN